MTRLLVDAHALLWWLGDDEKLFDRLLAAQALAGEIPLVTRDPALAAYGVTALW